MVGVNQTLPTTAQVPGDYTMDHPTMLTDVLKLHFAGWHLARLKCLSALIVAVFKVKTVNLTQLATAFPGRAEPESHYRRIQRFFQHIEIKPALIAHVVVAFLPYTTYTVALDRTTWMLGCFPMNFLVLSVVHQGIAFPIFWTLLPKKGNSNTKERIELLNRFIAVFGTYKIDCLLADREFIGKEWFAYLKAHHIRFHIRIKRDMHIARTNGRLAPAMNFFRSLPLATYCTLHGPRLICDNRLWVTGMRLPDGEYVIVVSDTQSDHVMEEYKRRWKIEVLFESLKSRGFNFEDTHLQDEKRLNTLFAVLAMAFCWAYHVGAWRHEVKPVRIKKHQRPATSIFRYGFDWIRHALFNPQDKPELLTHVLNLLWQALTGPKALVYQLYSM
jgi:Transposase DDE domain